MPLIFGYERSLLSYEVWYNGDVSLQIENDTYPFCRERHLERLTKGKITPHQMTMFDSLWAIKHEKKAPKKTSKK